jgi:hypothetical protein
MSAGTAQGPSKVVAIFVALVGAAGLIVAALITSGVLGDGDDGPPVTPEPSEEAEVTSDAVVDPPDEAPEIGGAYHLDPGNARIILVEERGNDSYAVSEQLPADWPFSGTVEFVGEDTFTGPAQFDAGATMQVTMVLVPDGKLVTTFDFETDNEGESIARVDEHLLVPV